MVGRHARTGSGLLGAVLRTATCKAEEQAIAQRARELLSYVGIERYADYRARTLSYGDQRRLEVARALALRPKVLLLDEPTAGLDPLGCREVKDLILALARRGKTVEAAPAAHA